ncbi:MAG: type IV pilus modification protein PilV [Stenotrophobium sp.]
MTRLRYRMLGFTMIEVLIALIVLTLGLLGVAGLQIYGVRNTNNSYYRSQAAIVMNDMAERIYANVPAVQQGQYGGFDSRNVDCARPPDSLCVRETAGSGAVACTSKQMAAYDTFAATCGLPQDSGSRGGGVADLLPGGRVQTDCLDAAGAVLASCERGARVRVLVSWSERQAKGEGGALIGQSMQMLVQP